MINKQIKFPISEIFGPTIQGEGSMIGVPTIFVRTGGCDYRCKWCDTMYSVDTSNAPSWKMMSSDEVVAKVVSLSPIPCFVTLSGGNPAAQPLGQTIRLLHEKGYRVAVETQGSIFPEWINECDVVTISPKPPSSGNPTQPDMFGMFYSNVKADQVCVKVVVMDRKDYEYATSLLKHYDGRLFVQPCNQWVSNSNANHYEETKKSILEVAKWIMEDDNMLRMTILPQLHVWLYGMRRGV